jgi:murein DD-endopeptidase MepM/ murein hydrolase activator NlpD
MRGHRATAGLAIVVALAGAASAASAVGVPDLVGVVVPDLGPAVPCLTAEQEQAIHAQLAESRARLASRGELLRPDPNAAPATVLFAWPLRLHPVIDDPGSHALANYVDHDPAPGFRLDPQCGPRTYDLPTYNHTGTDLFTWPYRWLRMDRDEVQIVAAAPGQILGKVDGESDESCGFGSSAWNAVYIQHADGSQAWYGHMKRGSTTAKPEGAMVAQGEVLGIVGSSGNSTGPHLHFQVFDGQGRLIDPYAGPCNTLNAPSWWASQRPYNDSAVNALRTHDTPAEFPPCPLREIPHERNAFLPGEEIFLAAYYRDQLAGQVGQYVVRDAAGTPVFQWSHSSPQPYYSASLCTGASRRRPEASSSGTGGSR